MNDNKKTPTKFFNNVKSKKQKTNKEFLKNIKRSSLTLYNKYYATGQIEGFKELAFNVLVAEKELKLLSLGVDTFIYEEDVLNYIENVSMDVVKIQELKYYKREIPDEIAKIVEKTKDIFDEFLVVFTDYTDRKFTQQDVVMEKDPILFGVFYNEDLGVMIDRYYFLGDWEDEYCDLTLSKMVAETKRHNNKNIEMKIEKLEDIEKLKKIIKSQSKEEIDNVLNKEENILSKIKKFFKRLFE